MDSPVAEQNAEPPDDAFGKVHDNADELRRIHNDMKEGEININDAISRYERKYGRTGVLELLEDLQKMHHVYSNLLEEVKNIPKVFEEEMYPEEAEASAIRNKYIMIGLIPSDYLPMANLWQLAKSAFDTGKKLWNGTVHIVGTYDREITNALRLDPGTTMTFQVGVPGGVTIGWERTVD